mmetsp:Transcript_13747/g.29562  ORF Transcript_13747/g.29562 Transcript_13747/m.29562 type:complete len:226 (-) Transcript_13747:925-1602(-)
MCTAMLLYAPPTNGPYGHNSVQQMEGQPTTTGGGQGLSRGRCGPLPSRPLSPSAPLTNSLPQHADHGVLSMVQHMVYLPQTLRLRCSRGPLPQHSTSSRESLLYQLSAPAGGTALYPHDSVGPPGPLSLGDQALSFLLPLSILQGGGSIFIKSSLQLCAANRCRGSGGQGEGPLPPHRLLWMPHSVLVLPSEFFIPWKRPLRSAPYSHHLSRGTGTVLCRSPTEG